MHRAWLAHALQKYPRSAGGSAQFGQFIVVIPIFDIRVRGAIKRMLRDVFDGTYWGLGGSFSRLWLFNLISPKSTVCRLR